MSWTNFNIKTVYHDGNSTPIENAFVFVKFLNSNNQWNGNYFTGYTNQNGIITINSNTATTNSTNILYRAIDENKWLQEGDFSETIVNNTQYLIEFDIDGNGIEWNYSYKLNDALYGAITFYGEKQINPKKIELYAKNRDETYSLVETYTSSTVTINGTYKTIEFLAKAYRYANDNNSIFWTHNINYKDSLGFAGGTVSSYVCDNYYDINIPKINDTINWNDSLKTLTNSNILITLTPNVVGQTVVSAETFSNTEYIRMYLSETFFNGGGITPFWNVVNPEFNTIKVYKNHYNDYENGCVISADTNGNYMFIVSGLSENEPIILEREPNVCMTNEDLFDYVVSLTGIRPDISKFSDYETDADLIKKVGVSKLPFYNDWISAITQYLPQQYQGQTASTLDDFKLLFVSEISTDYVQTNYASSLAVENKYLENSNHGYVWDRCFIPVSSDTFDNYLTFVPSYTKNGNSLPTVSLNKIGNPNDVQIEYRIGENGSWNSYVFDTEISFDDRISFRRNPSNTGITFSSANGYYNFKTTNNGALIALSGSVTSLLDGKGKNDTELSYCCFIHLFEGCSISQAYHLEFPTNNLEERCYQSMFANCTLLTVPPDLPAMTLANSCYQSMFENCISLMTAPELPVTDLSNYSNCYLQMFEGCTSLTAAPNLPATALSQNCYCSMFNGCTSLTEFQQTLPSTDLKQSCYSQMFQFCTSLTAAPSLPAMSLADYCYFSMFFGCTSLTAAPNLPATNLASYCYSQMFSECTNITSMPLLTANSLTEGCYQRMFAGCSLLTGVTNLSAQILAVKCYESMFENCTSLQTPPQFNSTSGLRDECCKRMFAGCTSLNTIPSNSIQSWQSLGVSCFEEMFRGCSSLQLLPPILPAQAAKDYCYKGMFAYCINLNVRTNGFSILANNLQNTSGACESMFEGCISMTSGITANSVKIGPDSYKRMFYGCINMSYIRQKFSATTSGVFNSTNANEFTNNWVYNVSSTGGFITVNQTWFNSYAFYGPNGIPNNTGWRVGIQ